MTFKGRLTMAAALAVAVAIALASVVVYVIVARELKGQIDENLRQLASQRRWVQPGQIGGFQLQVPEEPLGGAPGYVQIVREDGTATRSGNIELPITRRTLSVAAGRGADYFQDMTVQGIHIRVFTRQVAPSFALQIARPLDEVDEILQQLRWILFVITGAGIALATGLGGLVAQAALGPVRRLSRATEHISTTSDLTHRIHVDKHQTDELNKLATSFNSMLDALERSLRSQRQLVADASHELRTPITSLRTNIEVLAREEHLSPEQRRELRNDIVSQLDELTVLIGDVVELARGNEPVLMPEVVRLDEIVADSIDRARRLAPASRFEADLQPVAVHGVASRLGRAINNLLDNAIKWSPEGGIIEVCVSGGEIVVRDHGPGISEEDLPLVFDRFYRSSEARGMPGSGLGLAIVKQIAESHGGTVVAERAATGGALFRLRLPVVVESDDLAVDGGTEPEQHREPVSGG